jgi:hypothetical protein
VEEARTERERKQEQSRVLCQHLQERDLIADDTERRKKRKEKARQKAERERLSALDREERARE